ncbi:MAG: hypothetical protein J6I83_01575, partial [Firmicutes bacterium]|nr:hypothetical protein [Bacillota bacterium]
AEYHQRNELSKPYLPLIYSDNLPLSLLFHHVLKLSLVYFLTVSYNKGVVGTIETIYYYNRKGGKNEYY